MQWLQHGSFSVVAELAPPESLYLLDTCDTIPLRTIHGKVSVRFPKVVDGKISDDFDGEGEGRFDYTCR